MKGNKRNGRHPGTWELRMDGGEDPLTRKRQQKSVTFHGTSREADVALTELITKSSRGQVSVGRRTVAHAVEAGLRQAGTSRDWSRRRRQLLEVIDLEYRNGW